MTFKYDAPNGFSYLYTLGGLPPRVRVLPKLSGSKTPIFANDVVYELPGGGSIESLENKSPRILSPIGVSMNYGAASTATMHHVLVGSNVVFEAPFNADLGRRVHLLNLHANVDAGAGSGITLFSGHSIDRNTLSLSVNRELRLLGSRHDPDYRWREPRILARFHKLR